MQNQNTHAILNVSAPRRSALDAFEDVPQSAHLGISHVWMPPGFKATNEKDVGYGVYDLFDLGEFNKKVLSAPSMVSKKTIFKLFKP